MGLNLWTPKRVDPAESLVEAVYVILLGGNFQHLRTHYMSVAL